MPFKMLDDLSVFGRRGDSASFTFEFDKEDISDYSFVFQIKKNISDSEDSVPVRKLITNPSENSFVVELTRGDTLKLETAGLGYTYYCWGLKAYIGDDYAQTLIPKDNAPAPKFCVLPAIAEDLDDDD